MFVYTIIAMKVTVQPGLLSGSSGKSIFISSFKL